ncbi:hypothetical protein PIB30_079240 [Stylosanthes scabra]|uniref:Uncharacterized protein n=1 Tax=Stylosanthes scabra TaxID=79078 RepID=A0ABU6YNP3_9FABA|nr:hypothetical protein [Stylosanthes scabra]
MSESLAKRRCEMDGPFLPTLIGFHSFFFHALLYQLGQLVHCNDEKIWGYGISLTDSSRRTKVFSLPSIPQKGWLNYLHQDLKDAFVAHITQSNWSELRYELRAIELRYKCDKGVVVFFDALRVLLAFPDEAGNFIAYYVPILFREECWISVRTRSFQGTNVEKGFPYFQVRKRSKHVHHYLRA